MQCVRACKDCVQDVHEGVRASSPTTPHPQPLLLPNHSSSLTTPPPQPLLLPNHSSSPTTPPAQPLLLPNHSSHPTTTLPQPFFLPNHSSYPTTTLHQPLFLPNHFSSPTNPPPRPLLLPCVHARRACMQVVRAYTQGACACKSCVRACVRARCACVHACKACVQALRTHNNKSSCYCYNSILSPQKNLAADLVPQKNVIREARFGWHARAFICCAHGWFIWAIICRLCGVYAA